MALLTPWRRKAAGSAAPGDVTEPRPGGKNRPTPKRREAIAARPVTPYMKGGGAKTRRGRTRADRASRRESVQQRRSDAERGELPRDRGPERALTRDMVDSRRSPLTLLVWIAGGSFLVGLVPNVQAQGIALSGMLAFLIVGLGDGLIMANKISRRVSREFPDTQRKIRFYAIQRAVAPRRLRVPKPRVKPNDPV
jgi:hypothetical protein